MSTFHTITDIDVDIMAYNDRISVTIVVAFVARGLSNIPGEIFCYSAISSAGVVVILPGFTIRRLLVSGA